jgi:23S rRNA-/tRNA-specific pseudouridylate synthase
VKGPLEWTVRAGDGPRVRDVLQRAGLSTPEATRAVAEGRVFVGRTRMRDENAPVRVGDVVSVAPDVVSSARPVVLGATADLVAVLKPAGMPTIADHAGAAHALVAQLALEMGIDPARLHPTSRLDRDVSGVVVFAMTSEAAARLRQARESGAYERRYVALAASAPDPPAGEWDAPIGRARDPRLRRAHGADAVPAWTRYRVRAVAARGEALLAVGPVTGRTHQIRVHAAHAGAPLLGDPAYGGPARLTCAGGRVVEPRRIALHAARVSVPDAHGGRLTAVAPAPPELLELWSGLGGDPAAWDGAVTCVLPPSSSPPPP